MKKLILALFFVLSAFVYGQSCDSLRAEVCIYDYGKPITYCESNFENLFANWNKWIANRDKLQPLSWEYVETLKDNERIALYAGLMFDLEKSTTVIGHGSGGYSWKNGNMRGYRFAQWIDMKSGSEFLELFKDTPHFAGAKAEMERSYNDIRKSYLAEAQTGDKVYLLKFRKGEKIYDYYVVCNAKTCKPLTVDFLTRVGGEKTEIDNWLQSNTSNFAAFEWNLNNKHLKNTTKNMRHLYGFITFSLSEEARKKFREMPKDELEKYTKVYPGATVFSDDTLSCRIYFPFKNAIVEYEDNTYKADENGEISIQGRVIASKMKIIGIKRSEFVYGGGDDIIEGDNVIFKRPREFNKESHASFGQTTLLFDCGEFEGMK